MFSRRIEQKEELNEQLINTNDPNFIEEVPNEDYYELLNMLF